MACTPETILRSRGETYYCILGPQICFTSLYDELMESVAHSLTQILDASNSRDFCEMYTTTKYKIL